MTIKEAIRQLEHLKSHCMDFLDKEEPDSIWHQDVQTLDMAIDKLKEVTSNATDSI